MIFQYFKSKAEYESYVVLHGANFIHEPDLVFYITKKGNIKVVKSRKFKNGKYTREEFLNLFSQAYTTKVNVEQ